MTPSDSASNLDDRFTDLGVIVLAAGKGTRMQSDLPKVMHEAADRPMVTWVVDAAEQVGATPAVLVVGHGADLVREAFSGRGVEFVVQSEQLGTGHAVDMARSVHEAGRLPKDVLVLCGDGPLIRADTLRALVRRHREGGAAATLATATLDDASGYGRIARAADGSFARIVEQKDATEAELAIREVNPSYYVFDTAALFERLGRLENANASGEYYITDVFEMLLRDGLRVEVIDAVPAEDVLSVNDPNQLAEVDRILRSRLAGVSANA